jgi:hypothetical protein
MKIVIQEMRSPNQEARKRYVRLDVLSLFDGRPGADTDCCGELIGSILGAYFGPGHLDERWLAPFNQGRLASTRTGLGCFYEQ